MSDYIDNLHDLSFDEQLSVDRVEHYHRNDKQCNFKFETTESQREKYIRTPKEYGLG